MNSGSNNILDRESIKELEEILGTDYNTVKNFYYAACSVDVRYKVFLTRRSYVLFRLFKDILSMEDPSFAVKGEIYNTHSLKQLELKIEKEKVPDDSDECKVLVIDDIVINGRTISGIEKRLRRAFNGKNCIKLWCILFYKDAPCISVSAFESYCIATRSRWEQLSNRLTDFIIASNIGYVSFMDTFYLSRIEADRLRNSLPVGYEYESKTLDAFDVKVYIAFLPADEYFGLDACVRFYYRGDKCTIIPYVFLPEWKSEDCVKNCNKLLSSLDVDVSDLPGDSDRVGAYIATIRKAGKWVADKCMVGFNYNAYVCDESFRCCGESPTKTLEEPDLEEQDIDSEIIECLSNLDYAKNEQADFEKLPDEDDLETTSEVEHNSRIIKYYLGKMRVSDDERAMAGKQRLIGLRIEDVVNSIGGNANAVKAAIIGNWDEGKSSYVVFERRHKGEPIVTGFVRNGEQAYKDIYELYAVSYALFYMYYMKFGVCDKERMLKIASMVDKIIGTNRYSLFVNRIDAKQYMSDILAVEPLALSVEEKKKLLAAWNVISGGVA